MLGILFFLRKKSKSALKYEQSDLDPTATNMAYCMTAQDCITIPNSLKNPKYLITKEWLL
jgi:hypothetical protein